MFVGYICQVWDIHDDLGAPKEMVSRRDGVPVHGIEVLPASISSATDFYGHRTRLESDPLAGMYPVVSVFGPDLPGQRHSSSGYEHRSLVSCVLMLHSPDRLRGLDHSTSHCKLPILSHVVCPCCNGNSHSLIEW